MSKGTPLHAEDDKDRCEAITLETHWKRERKVDLRCPFVARIKIGAKRLCHKHAQCEAIAVCLKKGMAAIIITKPVYMPYQEVKVISK